MSRNDDYFSNRHGKPLTRRSLISGALATVAVLFGKRMGFASPDTPAAPPQGKAKAVIQICLRHDPGRGRENF